MMDTTLDRLDEALEADAQPRTVGRVVHTGGDPASDPRREIPALGFRDYWYPLLGERQVPRGKPRMVKLLGQELCVFRGQHDVAAVSNFCAHRGTRLSRGNCHYAGTVTCPYHGWTYDERGECVAALPEGPDSRMPGRVRVRRYPTRTLKGVVFVWMGEGEPTDPDQDLPPELFDESFVQHDATIWHANWRPALENFQDLHAPYVHRNALQMLINPIVKRSFQGARPVIRGGGVALDRYSDGKRANAPYREYFAGVDGHWPKHRWRLLWTWLFGNGKTRRRPHDTAGMKTYHPGLEWTNGPHMPGMQRIDHATWMYTRWCVPIDENTTREFYLHATRPGSELARLRQRLTFPIRHRWLAYRNFGLQDGAVLADTPYDRPERFSQTDVETIGWRTLAILSARYGGRHDAIPPAVIEKLNARAAPDGELASPA